MQIGNTDYWRAWFDGAALPNPGKIGIGALVISPAGARFEKSALAGCNGCSNEAELHALCAALELAHGAGAKRLVVRGDSDIALRYVAGPESTQILRLVMLVAHARDWLRRFDDVQLLWVPRHRNAEADRFSRQALGLPDKPSVPVTRKTRRR